MPETEEMRKDTKPGHREDAFTRVCRLLDEVRRRKPEDQLVVAIDGHCASGKTTLGGQLKETYDCTLIHMDDFYPTPAQRTKERMQEIGGHIDYERFTKEIVGHLSDPEGLRYRPLLPPRLIFGEEIREPYRKLIVIEGAYSQHPRFGDIYDLRFFYDIDPKLQLERILKRNGPEKLIRFREEWIPKENRYLEAFHIREQSILL